MGSARVCVHHIVMYRSECATASRAQPSERAITPERGRMLPNGRRSRSPRSVRARMHAFDVRSPLGYLKTDYVRNLKYILTFGVIAVVSVLDIVCE